MRSPPEQCRVDERHRLQPDIGVPGSSSEVDVGVEQLAQPEVLSERRRPDETGVGDDVVVVEAHLNPVERVRR